MEKYNESYDAYRDLVKNIDVIYYRIFYAIKTFFKCYFNNNNYVIRRKCQMKMIASHTTLFLKTLHCLGAIIKVVCF